jgi:hypothetical protein
MEGRRAFARSLAGIEGGAECERFAPLLSALADGEASPEQLAVLRPHMRTCLACRARLKAFRAAPTRVAALVPPAALVMAGVGPLRGLLESALGRRPAEARGGAGRYAAEGGDVRGAGARPGRADDGPEGGGGGGLGGGRRGRGYGRRSAGARPRPAPAAARTARARPAGREEADEGRDTGQGRTSGPGPRLRTAARAAAAAGPRSGTGPGPRPRPGARAGAGPARPATSSTSTATTPAAAARPGERVRPRRRPLDRSTHDARARGDPAAPAGGGAKPAGGGDGGSSRPSEFAP